MVLLTRSELVFRTLFKHITSDSVLHGPGQMEVDDQSPYEYEDFCPSYPDVHWKPLIEEQFMESALTSILQGRSRKKSLLFAMDFFNLATTKPLNIITIKLAQTLILKLCLEGHLIEGLFTGFLHEVGPPF